MDDCLYDQSWTRDKMMRLLFMNGRHWKIMLIITMQYPLGIPPNLRTNIDYVFILREPYLTNRKRIWENYASMFPTLESFCAVMDNTTENYECLVINNNAKSNKLTDQIFGIKQKIMEISSWVPRNFGKSVKILVRMMKMRRMTQIIIKRKTKVQIST